MDRVIDNLSDLFVFVKVVELKSFSAAARATGSTKSTVSKQVRRLEEALGTRLLNRTTRHLGLTETGQSVYVHGVRIFEETTALYSSVDNLQEKPRGRLRVSTSVAFGNMHLTRLMNDFLVQYPDISVSLTLNDRYVDVVDEGFDVAIRLTSTPIESFVARRLSAIEYAVCATPEYLAAHPHITQIDDLAAHNCLLNGHAPDAFWRFTRDEQKSEIRVSGRLTVNSSESLRIAVLGGNGIGLLPVFAIADDLKAGRLCTVLQEWTVEGSFGDSVYAIFLPSKFIAPKIRVFIDYLVARFEAGGNWSMRQIAN